jgi:RNA polymerase sigma factor (sigma-70 family)
LEKDLTKERINQQLDKLLHQLPSPNQTVFELKVQQQMSVEDIAEIRKIPVIKVIQHLHNAKKWIRLNFINKYKLQHLTNAK